MNFSRIFSSFQMSAKNWMEASVKKPPAKQAAQTVNIKQRNTLGMHEGAAAPSYEIRSSDMCGAGAAASRFLDHFLAVRFSAQENDVNRCKNAPAGLLRSFDGSFIP